MVAPASKRLRVLVVEDDPAYRELAREALTGHERFIAATAREGLELFNDNQPDICFLDLSLPDDNGLEILLEIREANPEAYVVILTSSRLPDDVAMAQRCAANGYIAKPFSRKQLLDACEASQQYREKMDKMGAAQRLTLHQHIRNEVEQLQKQLHAPTPEAQAAMRQLLPRWPLLVAGEREDMALHWVQLLRDAGCHVSHAGTGAEALSHLTREPCRLLLMQDTLPDSDAAELLYRLRVNQLRLATMVVVDAGWKQQSPKWRKLGVTRLFCAPLADTRLVVAVEKEIARSLHEVEGITLQM